MFDLNLPECGLKLRKFNGKQQVFDVLRKKFVALTPEEWVRQHFISFLIQHKGYPPGRMVNEAEIFVNGQKRRCDTVVYDEFLQPLVVLEFKAPEVVISQSVFNQISAYNFQLKVPVLIISNGKHHYCCRMDGEKMSYMFESNIPDYSVITKTP